MLNSFAHFSLTTRLPTANAELARYGIFQEPMATELLFKEQFEVWLRRCV